MPLRSILIRAIGRNLFKDRQPIWIIPTIVPDRCPTRFLPIAEGNSVSKRFYIPERVLDYFNEEFDYREVANSSELTDIAVVLFVGMLDTPVVSTGGGGGGSQSDLPWRDKDDDDLQWARRCARAATLLLGKKPRTGLRR